MRVAAGAGGRVRLPPHAPGQRIGLYGGSFDPAHRGHRHVATVAMRRLKLDRVWWLVTPGNPLKDRRGLPPAAERVRQAQTAARHPRMVATGFEEVLGFAYTVETVRFLVRRCPDVSFVWIVGADSFATMHRWRAWKTIARSMPIAVVDRPGWTLAALRSRAARTFAAGQIRPARRLPTSPPPAWTFIHAPRSSVSSTTLRAKDKTRTSLPLKNRVQP